MKRFVIFFAAFLLFPNIVLANGYDDWCGRGWGHMMNFGYGGGVFMWIIFLIVVGLLAYFIIEAIKSKSDTSSSRETPIEILKKRYAKGEITKEEFDKMKKDLES